MKRAFVPAMILWIILTLTAFGQEIYQWVDEKGTVHFADDPTLIPEKYRDQAQKKKVPKESSPSPAPATVPQTEKKPGPESPSIQRDRFGRGEEWWREKVKEWEDKLKTAQANYENANQARKAKEKELEDSRFKPDSWKRKLSVEIKELEEKIKTSQEEAKEAVNMLEKVLPSQAQEDRADPNWVKPKEKAETFPGPGSNPDTSTKQ